MIWQSRLLPELDCDVVLLDRWDTSTWVYGRAAGLDDAFIAAVTKDGRPADHTLLLDGALMSAATDTYEADTVFMSRVREEYLRWGKEHGAAVINANQSRVVVTAQLQAHCDTWLAR
jgi:thymidylate kinase